MTNFNLFQLLLFNLVKQQKLLTANKKINKTIMNNHKNLLWKQLMSTKPGFIQRSDLCSHNTD